MVQPDTQTASAPVGVSGTESPVQAGEQEAATAPVVQSADELVDDELLVEEVSIDGMCGVY
ncbi:MAG: mycofactocin precursor MftA [Solirubrobacteraceae bacterium]